MSSFFTVICLVGMIIPCSVANIICYPFLRKVSIKISDYIVRVMAPRLFAVLKLYKKFNFWQYTESKINLPEQFIVISNHQSLLDIPCYMNVFPNLNLRFVAKDALGNLLIYSSKGIFSGTGLSKYLS